MTNQQPTRKPPKNGFEFRRNVRSPRQTYAKLGDSIIPPVLGRIGIWKSGRALVREVGWRHIRAKALDTVVVSASPKICWPAIAAWQDSERYFYRGDLETVGGKSKFPRERGGSLSREGGVGRGERESGVLDHIERGRDVERRQEFDGDWQLVCIYGHALERARPGGSDPLWRHNYPRQPDLGGFCRQRWHGAEALRRSAAGIQEYKLHTKVFLRHILKVQPIESRHPDVSITHLVPSLKKVSSASITTNPDAISSIQPIERNTSRNAVALRSHRRYTFLCQEVAAADPWTLIHPLPPAYETAVGSSSRSNPSHRQRRPTHSWRRMGCTATPWPTGKKRSRTHP
jgi:hypothetical protein